MRSSTATPLGVACRSGAKPVVARPHRGHAQTPFAMDITLNNLPEHIDTHKAAITVNELLAIKRFTFKMLVVKVNGKLVKKNEYSIATIKDGDDVQVIHLISGG